MTPAEPLADRPRGEFLNDLRIAEYRVALGRITQHYPPDTIAGRLAADVLAKYPNQFENADRENDCEPFPVPEIEGLPHGPNPNDRLREALEECVAAREAWLVADNEEAELIASSRNDAAHEQAKSALSHKD